MVAPAEATGAEGDGRCAASPKLVRISRPGRARRGGADPDPKEFGTALATSCAVGLRAHAARPLPPEAELNARVRERGVQRLRRGGGRPARERRSALERIERYAGPGALLDLGCWVGFLLAEGERRAGRRSGSSRASLPPVRARALGLDVRTEDLFTPTAGGPLRRGGDGGRARAPHARGRRPRPRRGSAGARRCTRPAAAGCGQPGRQAAGRRWWSVIPTHVHYFTRTARPGCSAPRLRDRSTSPPIQGLHLRYYLDKGGGYLPGCRAGWCAPLRGSGSPTMLARPTSATG